MLSGTYNMTDFHPQNIQNQQHNNGKFKIEKMQHFVVKCCIFRGLIMGQKGSGLKNIKCLRQFSHISSRITLSLAQI